MRRSGFSLLELLIALSLILAMAALTLPLVSRTLSERDFESTADRMLHQLRLARAEAQLTGRAVEVICRPDAHQLEARYFDPEQMGEEMAFDDDAARDLLNANQEYADSESDVIPDGWARIVVGRSFVLSKSKPVPMDRESEIDDEESNGEERVIRLALFMPDGSAILGVPLWLRDDEGRVGRLSVSRFTGLPRFERSENIAPEQPSGSESDSEDDDFDLNSSDESEVQAPMDSPDQEAELEAGEDDPR